VVIHTLTQLQRLNQHSGEGSAADFFGCSRLFVECLVDSRTVKEVARGEMKSSVGRLLVDVTGDVHWRCVCSRSGYSWTHVWCCGSRNHPSELCSERNFHMCIFNFLCPIRQRGFAAVVSRSRRVDGGTKLGEIRSCFRMLCCLLLGCLRSLRPREV